MAYQAITTKYHGPTNYRGARVSATTAFVIRRYYEWQDELNSTDNHLFAAKALATELEWFGRWIMGGLKSGYVFVCIGRYSQQDVDEFTVPRQERE